MGLFDTGITDSISGAINSLAKKQSDAIVEGFIQGAKIIADKLQEIEDNKNAD